MRGRSLTPLVTLVVLAPSLASQQPTRTARTTPPAIEIPLVRKAVVTIQALDASGQLMASGTVSRGIISASRVVKGTKLLQISAAISHGSSGAPVLNSRGQVIGIVRSTIEAGQSLNFATATDAIRNLNNDQGAVAEGQVLLTPKNIVNTGSGSARASLGSPVSLPQISVGQTLTASLAGTDSAYPDTTYYKMYQFTTTPGREITIDLSSSDFDPVLIVRGEGLAQSLVNDDGGPGCAARVSQAFLARGPYRILVNTTAAPHRQTGRFTLAISEGSQHVQDRSENDCSAGSRSPATTIRVGETINGTLTSSDSLYPDNSYFKYYQFTAPAGRAVTIDLSSDEFDPVLSCAARTSAPRSSTTTA